MSIFQDLYDSEINFKISCFWDTGFDIALGDDLDGVKDSTNVRRVGEIETWLRDTAIAHYPNSLFALMYRDHKSRWDAEELLRKVQST